MKVISGLVLVLAVLVIGIGSGCGQKSETAAPTAAPSGEEVESSLISKVAYDASTQTLMIQFESGDAYDYTGVPQRVYDGLMAAESKGKYFHAEIKDKFAFTKK